MTFFDGSASLGAIDPHGDNFALRNRLSPRKKFFHRGDAVRQASHSDALRPAITAAGERMMNCDVEFQVHRQKNCESDSSVTQRRLLRIDRFKAGTARRSRCDQHRNGIAALDHSCVSIPDSSALGRGVTFNSEKNLNFSGKSSI